MEGFLNLILYKSLFFEMEKQSTLKQLKHWKESSQLFKSCNFCFLNILYNINNAHNYELIGYSVPEFYEENKIDKISLSKKLFEKR